jgi:N-acetylneuraminate synthase/N,N'-diacetyllegionaminate synthase
VNHNGDIALARKLVEEAKRCGADVVKFQTFRAEALVDRDAPQAEYQRVNTGRTESQFEMLKKLELPFSAFRELKELAESLGLVFLSTPFDDVSVDLLEEIGVPAYKVSSGDLTNTLLLRRLARTGKPILLSTGMASGHEVEDAVGLLQTLAPQRLILLQCTTRYPCPPEQANLSVMEEFRRRFNVPVGFSDHTEGVEIPLAAVALGACVLEKHFTLGRDMEGPDHRVSLEPSELAALVQGVRKVEKAIGAPGKHRLAEEEATAKLVRKSLAAATDLPAGTILTEAHITAIRPGTGLDPAQAASIAGRKLKQPVKAGHLFAWSDFE